MFDGLPASARAFTEQNGGWTITDHLLARLIEETDKVSRTVWYSVPRKPGTKGPEPVIITRPGQAKPAPRRVSPIAFASMMGSLTDV